MRPEWTILVKSTLQSVGLHVNTGDAKSHTDTTGGSWTMTGISVETLDTSNNPGATHHHLVDGGSTAMSLSAVSNKFL